MRQANLATRVLRLLLVLTATGCASGNEAHDGGANDADSGSVPPVPMLDRSVPADGWRWESSLGVEVAVPADWKINDTDCNQTDAPSVVRSQGTVLSCLTAEPPTKQIIEIADERTAKSVGRPDFLTYTNVMVGSVAAERGEGETADGRAAGWLHLPSIHVIVDVRVKGKETLQRVLDSVRVIDTDHNLCATARKDMGPVAPRQSTLAPSHVSTISVCYFDKANVLQASALIEGDEAQQVADELNATKPGRNIDVPESTCLHESEQPPPDAVLLVLGDADHAQIEMTFSSCTHRGLSNGRAETQLTRPLLEAIMKPVATGYGFSPYGLTSFHE